jgi:hypothetical protein
VCTKSRTLNIIQKLSYWRSADASFTIFTYCYCPRLVTITTTRPPTCTCTYGYCICRVTNSIPNPKTFSPTVYVTSVLIQTQRHRIYAAQRLKRYVTYCHCFWRRYTVRITSDGFLDEWNFIVRAVKVVLRYICIVFRGTIEWKQFAILYSDETIIEKKNVKKITHNRKYSSRRSRPYGIRKGKLSTVCTTD